jgi:hypothetical protein
MICINRWALLCQAVVGGRTFVAAGNSGGISVYGNEDFTCSCKWWYIGVI